MLCSMANSAAAHGLSVITSDGQKANARARALAKTTFTTDAPVEEIMANLGFKCVLPEQVLGLFDVAEHENVDDRQIWCKRTSALFVG